MRTVTAFEAKTRFGKLLEHVRRGGEIVITRHDNEVWKVCTRPTGSWGLPGYFRAHHREPLILRAGENKDDWRDAVLR